MGLETLMIKKVLQISTLVNLYIDVFCKFQYNFISRFGKNPNNNIILSYKDLKSILPVEVFNTIDTQFDNLLNPYPLIDKDIFKNKLITKSIDFTEVSGYKDYEILTIQFNIEFFYYLTHDFFIIDNIISDDIDCIKEYELKL